MEAPPVILGRYLRWLHTGWPAGTVEKLPEVNPDGTTNLPGVRIVGDLTGIPLLKFSSDTGAKAVQALLAEPGFQKAREAGAGDEATLDLAIIGAGVAGMAAAIEARRAGLRFRIFEATEPFSTIVNFPKRKPIYAYPTEMTPAGALQFTTDVKEDLVAELERYRREYGIEPVPARIVRLARKGGLLHCHHGDGATVTAARRVIVAIGRSGNFRKLGVPGEGLDKVYNRLHDPKEFAGRRVLVVGGGDSALETAVALACGGADVTLSYRQPELSRPKPENVEKARKLAADSAADVQVEEPTSERVATALTDGLAGDAPRGTLTLALGTRVTEIRPDRVTLRDQAGAETAIPNQVVFAMIGREAPLDFFRRSGIRIRGEWTRRRWAGFLAFFLFCVALYNWKSGGFLDAWSREAGAFPYNLGQWAAGLAPGSLLGITVKSAQSPSFWYTVAYSLLVVTFGVRRIRRRRTPYVTWQTLTLMAIQVVPLFLLPEILLPWLDAHGWLPAWLADSLFPRVNYGHGREFWRAYGFILAWPLNVYNVFTHSPIWGWLGISFVQTFVLIPLMIWRWGKGAYCGWICSCGALAETLGDNHRQKMLHGPRWNRWNMLGQGVLAVAFLLLLLRVLGWAFPGLGIDRFFYTVVQGSAFSYKWVVDVFLAGAVGYGFYFWFSGRVWCRFACPLAALMHVYARFSRFRIFAEKKKCISCNVCTSVCHQGIDVMSFANKGQPMEDPECVRCSACVQSCPTGVLTFGRFDAAGAPVYDRLAASPVQMAEAGTQPGKP